MCAVDFMTTAAESDLLLPFGLIDPGPFVPGSVINYPMKDRLVIRQGHGGVRAVSEANWGFVPRWAADPSAGRSAYNARAESLAEGKPMFRDAFRLRRCLLVGTSFIEHGTLDGRKAALEFLVENDGAPYAYAGLWDEWAQGTERMQSCTMVTCEPNAFIAQYHTRMPVILDPRSYRTWLDAGSSPDELLSCLEPFASERFSMRRAILPPRREPSAKTPSERAQDTLF